MKLMGKHASTSTNFSQLQHQLLFFFISFNSNIIHMPSKGSSFLCVDRFGLLGAGIFSADKVLPLKSVVITVLNVLV